MRPRKSFARVNERLKFFASWHSSFYSLCATARPHNGLDAPANEDCNDEHYPAANGDEESEWMNSG